jgi:hypothetical protein
LTCVYSLQSAGDYNVLLRRCMGLKPRRRARSVMVKLVTPIGRRNRSSTALGLSRTGSGEPGPVAGSLSATDMTAFDTAFRRIAEGAPLVIVLGGAGTGKTTFLHELRRRAGVRQVFLAPTGVAALQLGGQTIHSFFGIPPRILNPDEVKPRARNRKLLGKIDRLVIDEVSMVRCDLLDVVDRCLRIARNRSVAFRWC